ncbi:hypothetical protein NDU88_006291 [Pleurodeles waltl]|uniref:Uncharacterized protein n=1 Tax=Pleurodeles waltl TaxID=8319 RepID=A0AAV7PI10_PLEWA|nr:hypothetical protein NDU88_006291 [Pleurodeles waltl]
MLTKPLGSTEDRTTPPGSICPSPAEEGRKARVTRSFMEALFTSLRNDTQAVKKDLLVDLREVQQNLEEIGDRVYAVEDREPEHEWEVEWLRGSAVVGPTH